LTAVAKEGSGFALSGTIAQTIPPAWWQSAGGAAHIDIGPDRGDHLPYTVMGGAMDIYMVLTGKV
jgi:hypothetical protein